MRWTTGVALVAFSLFLFFTGAGAERIMAQEEFLNARSMYHDYYDARGVSYDEAYSRFGQDYASTACFIASQSHVGVQDVYRAYSSCGSDWFRVLVHFNINPSILFLPVPTSYNVGPPYGNAYGYWKKHQKNPSYRMVLASHDVVNLVNMNVIHVQLGMAVVDIMQYRAANQTFPVIINNAYQKMGRGSYKVPSYNNANPGHDNGHGNDYHHDPGHDKGHGNDYHNDPGHDKGHGNDYNNGQGQGQGQGQGHGNNKKK
jgi:hypothetical protein